MQEEFRDAVGYEHLFSVSSIGRIYSKRTNKILKTLVSKTGYEVFSTRIGGRAGVVKCFKVHKLVAEAFIPNIGNKPCVNHKDGVKTNNCTSNLEWITHSENTKHAYTLGLLTSCKGENHGKAILCESDVKAIKALHAAEGIGRRKISARLNLPLDAVSGVLHKNNWSHLN